MDTKGFRSRGTGDVTTKRRLRYIYHDGESRAAGFRGRAPGDCVVRATALATGLDYGVMHKLVGLYNQNERMIKSRRKHGKLHPDVGMRSPTIKRMLKHFGFTWVPLIGIDSGFRFHMLADDLPPIRLIVNLSQHVSYVDNRDYQGLVYDTYDPKAL